MRIAEYNPKFPISVAITSNFSYNGVAPASCCLRISSICPAVESAPTTTTSALPFPFTILVPEKSMGWGISCFVRTLLPN